MFAAAVGSRFVCIFCFLSLSSRGPRAIEELQERTAAHWEANGKNPRALSPPRDLARLLRGTKLGRTMNACRLFALLTDQCVACFMIVLLLGAYAAMTSGGHP